jgi:hypothetical protein
MAADAQNQALLVYSHYLPVGSLLLEAKIACFEDAISNVKKYARRDDRILESDTYVRSEHYGR